jgi:hypothetical protein
VHRLHDCERCCRERRSSPRSVADGQSTRAQCQTGRERTPFPEWPCGCWTATTALVSEQLRSLSGIGCSSLSDDPARNEGARENTCAHASARALLNHGQNAVHALLLQNWITLSTEVNSPNITQGAGSWIETEEFEDLVFFLDVKQQSGAATFITYQTAPVPEDIAFAALLPSIALSTGTRADRVLATFAPVPVARFLRWQLSGGASAIATFRVWVAAYSLD